MFQLFASLQTTGFLLALVEMASDETVEDFPAAALRRTATLALKSLTSDFTFSI